MKQLSEGTAGKAQALSVFKILLVMYILTGVLLVILAALLYKFELNESTVNIAVIVIYILIGFLGGFLAGKILRVKKFLWGAIMGAAYFLLLFLVSLILQKGISGDGIHFVTTMLLCVASGTVGGMVS